MNHQRHLGWFARWLYDHHDAADSMGALKITNSFRDHVTIPLEKHMLSFECDACFYKRTKKYFPTISPRHLLRWRGSVTVTELTITTNTGFISVCEKDVDGLIWGRANSYSFVACSRIFTLQVLWDCRQEVLGNLERRFGRTDPSVLAIKNLIYRPLVSLVSQELEK